MTNATNVTRPGQINGAGAVDATLLKVFSGEVLAAFQQEQVTGGRFLERTITQGKSATFPLTGRTKAYLHTPGTFIDGNKIDQNERVIPIDGKLLADFQISDLEEMQNHYDLRSIAADELGESLANEMDENRLRCAVLASRDATALVTGEPGGEEIVDASAPTVAANLVDSIASGLTKLTEKRVPKSQRSVFVRPVQFQLLQTSNLITNRDLGGIGSFSQGTNGPIQGTEIVETINMPNTNLSADTDVIAKYRANYSNVVAIAAHRSAVGTVMLMNMAMEIEWDARRQVYLLIAKQATGHDYLRNSAAVTVVNAATS